jgi:hypothetical protein
MVAAVALALSAWACANTKTMLAELVEARETASALHVAFARASEASNRAVMSDTDVAAAAAVEESKRAREEIDQNTERLQQLFTSLGFDEELGYLDEFKSHFDEYRRLDDVVLSLATENSNVKAQRLSFGPAREAADALRASLASAVGLAVDTWRAEALAAKAGNAVLDVLALQAPHIAEADDAVMTKMEERMAKDEVRATEALEQLKGAIRPAGAAQLAAAADALQRFRAVNKLIITLSRRNSDVRSLALSLGRKRTLAAQCDDQLRMLEQALAKHGFTATR